MSTAGTDGFHGAEYPGKNLAAATDFYSGFDNVANAGDAHFLPRESHRQRRLGDSLIADDHSLQRRLINGQGAGAVFKCPAQTDLVDRIVSQLESHSAYPLTAIFGVNSVGPVTSDSSAFNAV